MANPASSVSYNLDQQVTQITRADGSQLVFGYDASTAQLRTISPSAGAGSVVTLNYMASTGQLQSVVASGATQTFSYDGFLLSSAVLSGTVSATLNLGYDSDFRVASIGVNGSVVTQAYDPDSLLVQTGAMTITRHPQHGLATGSALGGVSTSLAYNGFGELESMSAALGASPLYGLQLGYDKLGRVVSKTEVMAGVSTPRTYQYDAAGRLAVVSSGGTQLASYGYDANGNRTQINGAVVATVDAQDRLLNNAAASYNYSAAGTLTQKTQGAQVTSYGYDIFGNLLSVTLPGGGQIGYLVDGSHRRMGKKVNGAVTQRWVYQDALRIAAEVDAAGAIQARFVYGERPNVPEYMVKGGVSYLLITDHLGSVRLVVSSSTGAVVQRIDYDEWGRVTSDSNPGFQPFGFAGGVYDADTGLVRFGARDYDAETGRWTAKDPIRFDGGDSNLYTYVGGNPVSYVDPTGEIVVNAVGAGVAAGVDILGQLVRNGGNWRCIDLVETGVAAATGAVFPGAVGTYAKAWAYGTKVSGDTISGIAAGAGVRAAYSVPPDKDGPYGRLTLPLGSLLPGGDSCKCRR